MEWTASWGQSPDVPRWLTLKRTTAPRTRNLHHLKSCRRPPSVGTLHASRSWCDTPVCGQVAEAREKPCSAKWPVLACSVFFFSLKTQQSQRQRDGSMNRKKLHIAVNWQTLTRSLNTFVLTFGRTIMTRSCLGRTSYFGTLFHSRFPVKTHRRHLTL